MKIYKEVEQKSEEWHQLRKGKVTGTGLKKLLGSKTLRDGIFFEILAERLTNCVDTDEPDFLRGQRLEADAISEFESRTGKIVEVVGFTEHSENPNMASSPDGLIKNGKHYTEAVETKCFASKNHIKYILEGGVPKDYYPQCVQYFIVNEHLETLYFVLYDPRVSIRPYHCVTLERDVISADIDAYREQEEEFLNEVEEKISELIEL